MRKLFLQSLKDYKSLRFMSSSSRRLEGKVAVVTASTDGIGYAIAERLGMDGAKVKSVAKRTDCISREISREIFSKNYEHL